jgi:hypothetical protein
MDRVPPVPAIPLRRWRPAICVALCLCIWTGTPRATEIYKSVDAEGHVTYSDRPDMSNAPVYSGSSDDGTDEVGSISTSTPPPPLPDSDQPDCPQDGDLWTPGFWVWNGGSFSWVPGVWVIPPNVDVFWTPGYWVFVRNVYVFHRGYWGPQVGYYGGINYGFGYPGAGYSGGRWRGHVFLYNAAVNHLNGSMLRAAYNEPEPELNHRNLNRVSYNGGPGGTGTAPNAQERLAVQSRLHSVPQRIHLQASPGYTPNIRSSEDQPSPAARPSVSREQEPITPRRNTASVMTEPPPPVNVRSRPAPAPKPVRVRSTPIRSVTLK